MNQTGKKERGNVKEPNVNERAKAVATYYCGEALGNAEKACIMAGYSPRYARGNAYKVVASGGVQEYIKYLNSLTSEKKIATIEEIQSFWTFVMNDENEQIKDRLRASELLAKGKGMFNDEW